MSKTYADGVNDALAIAERRLALCYQRSNGRGINDAKATRNQIAALLGERPISWEPDGRYLITGHGTLMTGPYPFDDHPALVLGRLLSIDNELWVVSGTEQTVRSKLMRRGDACGLLLNPAVTDI